MEREESTFRRLWVVGSLGDGASEGDGARSVCLRFLVTRGVTDVCCLSTGVGISDTIFGVAVPNSVAAEAVPL